MDKIKYSDSIIMKIIKNSKSRETRKMLLKEAGYDSLSKVRSGLKLSRNVSANEVYDMLIENHNQQVLEIRKQRQREKRKLKQQQKLMSFAVDYAYNDVIEAVEKLEGFIMLTATNKGEVVVAMEIDKGNKVNSYHKEIYQKLYYDLDVNDLQADKVIITQAKKVDPKKVAQAFKQGITNCLFTPMIKWAEDKRDNAKTKKTADNYKCRISNLQADELKYRELGVNEEDLQTIANRHQVDIKIDLPFEQDFITVKSQSKPLTKFKFVNTRLNHVELNQITSNQKEVVDEDELRNIDRKLHSSTTNYWEYTKNF